MPAAEAHFVRLLRHRERGHQMMRNPLLLLVAFAAVAFFARSFLRDFRRWRRGPAYVDSTRPSPVTARRQQAHRRLGIDLGSRLLLVVGTGLALLGSALGSYVLLPIVGSALVVSGSVIFIVSTLRTTAQLTSPRVLVEWEAAEDPKLRELREGAGSNAAAAEAYAQYLERVIQSMEGPGSVVASVGSPKRLDSFDRERLAAYKAELRGVRGRKGAA
jgi:hypothetical protein